MTRKEPRTAAGRDLLQVALSLEEPGEEHPIGWLSSILAIEAEASRPPASGDHPRINSRREEQKP